MHRSLAPIFCNFLQILCDFSKFFVISFKFFVISSKFFVISSNCVRMNCARVPHDSSPMPSRSPTPTNRRRLQPYQATCARRCRFCSFSHSHLLLFASLLFSRAAFDCSRMRSGCPCRHQRRSNSTHILPRSSNPAALTHCCCRFAATPSKLRGAAAARASRCGISRPPSKKYSPPPCCPPSRGWLRRSWR